MAKMVEVKCGQCKDSFMARVIDRKRGWGIYCSKSCKAKKQESRTGQYKKYSHSGVARNTFLKYAKEYGGAPQFHSETGDYEGFTSDFSNEEHDCNKD